MNQEPEIVSRGLVISGLAELVGAGLKPVAPTL